MIICEAGQNWKWTWLFASPESCFSEATLSFGFFVALLQLCVIVWDNFFAFQPPAFFIFVSVTRTCSVALLFLWRFGFLCRHCSVSLSLFKVLVQPWLLSPTSAHANVSVDPSKSCATIYVHRRYVYMSHLICQSCSVLYWDILLLHINVWRKTNVSLLLNM